MLTYWNDLIPLASNKSSSISDGADVVQVRFRHGRTVDLAMQVRISIYATVVRHL